MPQASSEVGFGRACCLGLLARLCDVSEVCCLRDEHVLWTAAAARLPQAASEVGFRPACCLGLLARDVGVVVRSSA